MKDSELKELKKHTKVRFEGNYSLDPNITPEERIARVLVVGLKVKIVKLQVE